MPACRCWSLLLLLLVPPASWARDTPWTLAAGANRTWTIAGLERVASGDKRVLRVALAGPDRVLVTGVKPGVATVRAFGRDGERSLRVRVVGADLADGFFAGDGTGLVRVDLEFLEVDGQLSESLGIRWPDAIQFSAAASVQGTAQNAGLNYAVPFTSGRAFLAHLARKGWARVLARPELHVRLGEEARFHSGGEYPVQNTVSTQAGFSRQIEWKRYGLTVKVRPRSSDWQRFHTEIAVDISELVPTAGIDGVPGLIRREIDTRVTARDGETVVLSGLLRELRSREREGIPGLSDIPLLKVLFSRTVERTERTELFLAMTLSVATRAALRDGVALKRARLATEEEAP